MWLVGVPNRLWAATKTCSCHWKFLSNCCHSVQNPQIPTWTCAVACHCTKIASGKPLHSHLRNLLPNFGFCCQMSDFVATCGICCQLQKTMQISFPHPTLTYKSHTTNNTMTDYSTSAATTANAAANATGGTTTNNDMDISEDNSESKASDDKEGMEDTLFHAARDIHYRMFCRIGMAGMENCHFCNFFGANMSIVSTVWDMLVASGLRLKKSCAKNLVWALYFVNVYPKQSLGCLVVGGSMGAVNPNTMRKWVWQFIENKADLADEVVSLFVNSRSHVSHCHLMPPATCHHCHPCRSSLREG
jgi:hypothetical protein